MKRLILTALMMVLCSCGCVYAFETDFSSQSISAKSGKVEVSRVCKNGDRPYFRLLYNGSGNVTVYGLDGVYGVSDKKMLEMALENAYYKRISSRTRKIVIAGIIATLIVIFALPVYRENKKAGKKDYTLVNLGLILCLCAVFGLSNFVDWYKQTNGAYEYYIVEEAIKELRAYDLAQFSPYVKETDKPRGILDQFLRIPSDEPVEKKIVKVKMFIVWCVCLAFILTFIILIERRDLGRKGNEA